MAAKPNASRAGSTEGAPRPAPEGDAAAWLQADGAAARLVQCVALEDDVAVGVGHQQVQAKVEASPAPAVLQDRGDTASGWALRGQSWQWGSGLCWAGNQGSLPAPVSNREPSGDNLDTAGDCMRASECQLPPRDRNTCHTSGCQILSIG